jgi:sec-independent protein translocase protein TatA
MPLGPIELIVILVIVMLLFGVGRISRFGDELGQAIRSFRSAVKPDVDEKS